MIRLINIQKYFNDSKKKLKKLEDTIITSKTIYFSNRCIEYGTRSTIVPNTKDALYDLGLEKRGLNYEIAFKVRST